MSMTKRPACFDEYECETRGCYGESVGVSGCEGAAALREISGQLKMGEPEYCVECDGIYLRHSHS